MSSSFALSVLFLFVNASEINTHVQLLLTVAFTTVCWLLTAYLGPQTDRRTLIDFYRKVHPFGPGWRRIRIEAGISEAEAATYAKADNIPLALLGWSAGTMVIWSSLFTVGNFLYGRTGTALALLASVAVSGPRPTLGNHTARTHRSRWPNSPADVRSRYLRPAGRREYPRPASLPATVRSAAPDYPPASSRRRRSVRIRCGMMAAGGRDIGRRLDETRRARRRPTAFATCPSGASRRPPGPYLV